MDWRQFKDYLHSLTPEKHIWRGQQKNNWHLQSSFHRSGRADLVQYAVTDLALLQPHITALTKSKYNLNHIDDQIEFISLLQHHGYPTPFLDWTLSPYIAAFFAFQNVKKDNKDDKEQKYARIFSLDYDEWSSVIQDPFTLACGSPQFTILNAFSMHNPRQIPQQAILTFTNVANIETFFQVKQAEVDKQFLKAIDIPWTERDIIMRELRLMGVTAASLFPGLDGTCAAFREQRFPKQTTTD
ncbi:FRG domain-containing protein [Methylocapsa polymorpha]|uniref:FRG domain-containing protein n=1 Tax=Methylocapsa polymorpha TaxID=3080828 RepID=A0ABZ0HR61_9HYPH|nr:FRG domain-containing protein [Methylocapsa sp. RX1]